MLVIPQRFGGLVIPRVRTIALPPTISFLSFGDNTANSTVYTYSNVSLGAAAATRRIIVAAHSSDSPGATTSSVTIAGVSATKVVEQVESFLAVSLWIAHVPTGTSGDIVINYPQAMDRNAYGAWRVVDLLSSVAEDTAVSQLDAESNTLNLSGLSAGAVVVAAATSGSSPSWSYTGTTLQYAGGWSDTSGSSQQFAGSHGQSVAGGSFPITQTTSGGGNTTGVAAAFR